MDCTEKLYYSDPFLTECQAKVISKRNGTEICLDRTVAYPEGGGQIADTGTLCFEGNCVSFVDAKKGVGRVFSVKDFPTVNVDTPIYHVISADDYDKFEIGQELTVKIDVNRRIWTTLHHSAMHLALMFAIEQRGNIYSSIKGCSITESSARLDFSLSERFIEQDISYINENLIKIIQASVPVIVFPYEGEDEAWFWKCQDFVCPCGGTHVTNSAQIGTAVARRKGIGKGSERLFVTVSNPNLSVSDYH